MKEFESLIFQLQQTSLVPKVKFEMRLVFTSIFLLTTALEVKHMHQRNLRVSKLVLVGGDAYVLLQNSSKGQTQCWRVSYVLIWCCLLDLWYLYNFPIFLQNHIVLMCSLSWAFIRNRKMITLRKRKLVEWIGLCNRKYYFGVRQVFDSVVYCKHHPIFKQTNETGK